MEGPGCSPAWEQTRDVPHQIQLHAQLSYSVGRLTLPVQFQIPSD